MISKVESISGQPLSLTVTETSDIVETVRTYNVDALYAQIDAIQKQSDDFVAARQVEIDYINSILGKGEKIGVVSTLKPIIKQNPLT